jgi:hypothetical protein
MLKHVMLAMGDLVEFQGSPKVNLVRLKATSAVFSIRACI